MWHVSVRLFLSKLEDSVGFKNFTDVTQLTFTFSQSTIETLEKSVKYVQS